MQEKKVNSVENSVENSVKNSVGRFRRRFRRKSRRWFFPSLAAAAHLARSFYLLMEKERNASWLCVHTGWNHAKRGLAWTRLREREKENGNHAEERWRDLHKEWKRLGDRDRNGEIKRKGDVHRQALTHTSFACVIVNNVNSTFDIVFARVSQNGKRGGFRLIRPSVGRSCRGYFGP